MCFIFIYEWKETVDFIAKNNQEQLINIITYC